MAGLYGNYSFPFLPYTGGQSAGFRTDYCTIVPPAANVHYVRSTGAADYDPPELTGRIITTINAALLECRAGRGDIVYVLPGHAESYSAANAWSNLVDGVTIMGIGNGSNRPTITFTGTAAQIAIAKKDCVVQNFMFTISGTVVVVNPFAVSGSGFKFVGNECMMGSSATNSSTDYIKLTAAGATDCKLIGNLMYSTVDAAMTSVMTTTGANDRLEIIGNVIQAGGTGVGNQLFDLSNAAIVQNNIIGNRIWNNLASSKYVIKPHANSTGWVDANVWGSGDAGTTPATSGWTTYTTGYRFGQNTSITTTGAASLLAPAVDS